MCDDKYQHLLQSISVLKSKSNFENYASAVHSILAALLTAYRDNNTEESEHISTFIGRHGGHTILLSLLNGKLPLPDDDGSLADCVAECVTLCTQACPTFPMHGSLVLEKKDRGIQITFLHNELSTLEFSVKLYKRRDYHAISNMLWAASIVTVNTMFHNLTSSNGIFHSIFSKLRPQKCATSRLCVIEVGAGLGLVGISLGLLLSQLSSSQIARILPESYCGIDIYVTDGDAKVVHVLDGAIKSAGLRSFQSKSQAIPLITCTAHVYDWDCPPPSTLPMADLILGSDVLYSPCTAKGVYDAIRSLMNRNGGITLLFGGNSYHRFAVSPFLSYVSDDNELYNESFDIGSAADIIPTLLSCDGDYCYGIEDSLQVHNIQWRQPKNEQFIVNLENFKCLQSIVNISVF